MFFFRPTFFHQFCNLFRTLFRNVRSQIVINNFQTHSCLLFVFVGRFFTGQFPQNNPERKNVCFFSVFFSLDDFRSHPLISSNFSSHFLSHESAPSKVSYFGIVICIYQNVETFQISMNNGNWKAVQIIHTLCNAQSNAYFFFPT